MTTPPWRTAIFSPCGRYRYLLGRDVAALAPPPKKKKNLWEPGWEPPAKALTGTMLFVMLNPSTADANIDDPTIRKCIKYAAASGFANLEVVNLFALRSTDPGELQKAEDPVGPENNNYIASAIDGASAVVLAYGCHGWKRKGDKATVTERRGVEVAEVIERDIQPLALKLTKYGQPSHPLYLPDATTPFPVRRDHAFGFVPAR